MERHRPAVHRTIIVVDVEGFGDPRRSNSNQLAIRAGLYAVLRSTFAEAGVPWDQCDHEDRGDAVFVLAPAQIPKGLFVERIPLSLASAVREHNQSHPDEEQVRLRMALHAGEVVYDDHGVTAAAVNLTFRLIDTPALKDALAASRGVLVLITSNWFFDEVVRHSPVLDPTTFRQVSVRVKETSTTGWISRPDNPFPADPEELVRGPAVRAPERIPHQLPAPPKSSVRRTAELSAVTGAVDDGGGVCAIGGPGGIGKTWLALRWAYDQLGRFPDGQLFVDLRGFSPEARPMHPAVAMRGFLEALGVDPARIPADPHTQAALFRSLVAGTRMLILLDNAVNAEQVVPLLPGSPTCTTVVTSRSRLPGLTTAHGARQVLLDILTDDQTRELLSARLGHTRMRAEPRAVDDLIGVLQRYPLALGIVAARAEAEASLSVTSLVAELREAGLGALDSVDPIASLPAVMSWSYRDLTREQAAVVVLVALAPGPDISLAAVTALSGLSTTRTRAVLRALEQLSLLHRTDAGRYQMHDLIRRYNAENADDHLPTAEQESALLRVVAFYLRTAYAADHLLDAHHEPVRLDDLPVADYAIPRFPTESAALAWLDTEHACVLEAQRLAITRGWHTVATLFAPVMHTYHWRRGRLDDQIAVARIGLAAVEQHGQPADQAMVHRLLAEANALTGRHTEALEHIRRALTLAESADDPIGEGHTHRIHAWTYSEHGKIEPALAHIIKALHLFKAAGAEEWQARAHNQSAWYSVLLGRYAEARAHVESALHLHRGNHNTNGEAISIAIHSFIAFGTNQHHDALHWGSQALILLQRVGNTFYEVQVLELLGQAHAALGHNQHARRYWRQAITHYREQHREKEAERVRHFLNDTH